MSQFIPIENGEPTQLQYMHSLYKCMSGDESLKPRFSSLGKWWRYKGLIKQLHNLFDDAWNTLDPVTQYKLNAAFERQELRIVTVGSIDTTGDMVVIPRTALIKLSHALQKEKCSICMGNNNDKKDCEFRKALKQMSIPDLRRYEKQYGKCMGQIFSWED